MSGTRPSQTNGNGEEEKELRELERRSDQEQRNFETTMATIAASIAGGNTSPPPARSKDRRPCGW